MIRIKMFEEYSKEIDTLTREIFDLYYTFEINDYYGDTGARITGPSEQTSKAQEIVSQINREIKKSTSGITSRHLLVHRINSVLKEYKYELEEVGYRITSWYNGASEPYLSK